MRTTGGQDPAASDMKSIRPDVPDRLSLTLLGVRFRNPVLVASGPLAGSRKQILRWLERGAGGVVTKTLYRGRPFEGIERTRLIPVGALNSTTYSQQPLRLWLEWIEDLAARDLPVLVSIHADDSDRLARLGEQVATAGGRILELGISCPNDGTQAMADAAFIHRYTSAVCRAVPIPAIVKLAADGALLENVQAALEAGARAISLSDALPACAIDVERRQLVYGREIGLTGPAIKPLVLNALLGLRAKGVECPIFGIGGIACTEDVVEYLLAGADAVQLYTALLKHGPERLIHLVEDLARWFEREDLRPEQVRGALREGFSNGSLIERTAVTETKGSR